MDHLPIPILPAYPPVQVPCLGGTERYDRLGFLDYPLRRGWETARLLKGDFTDSPPEKTASFLQNWLYFGLLIDVLGPEVNDEDYITTDSYGRLFVTTRRLHEDIKAWRSRQDFIDDHKRGKRSESIDRCLGVTQSMIEVLTPRANFDSPLSDEVLLSIMILGSSLNRAKGPVTKRSDLNQFSIADCAVMSHWGTSKLVLRRMMDNGWCPAEIARLHSNMDIIGMYYASFLRRRVLNCDHWGCSRSACKVNDIDETTYSTKHILDDCQCHHIGISSDDLGEILHSGSFPVIQVSHSESPDGVEAHTIPYVEGDRFVAISHVWSDGLGNVKSNSLPQCQLLRLQNIISRLSGPSTNAVEILAGARHTSFWIDTLCVPRSRSLKKLALLQMKEVYSRAETVLVLDSDLESSHYNNCPLEAVVRIYCCGWMTRLWTLEEGILARNLRFQFRDCAIDLNSLIPPVQITWDDLYISHIHVQTFRGLLIFRRIYALLREGRMGPLWGALTYRSTSNKGDEAVILCTLLGLDKLEMREILDGPEEERFKRLLSFMKQLPARVIFAPGRRLPYAGFRWAPSSFLGRGDLAAYDFGRADREPHMDSPVGHISKAGFIIQYPGYIISQEADSLPSSFCLKDAAIDNSIIVNPEDDSLDDTKPTLEVKTGLSALIMPRPLEIIPYGATGQYCVLLSAVRETDGVIYGNWRRRLRISMGGAPWRNPTPTDGHLSASSSSDLLPTGLFEGGRKHVNQMWCVS